MERQNSRGAIFRNLGLGIAISSKKKKTKKKKKKEKKKKKNNLLHRELPLGMLEVYENLNNELHENKDKGTENEVENEFFFLCTKHSTI